MQFRLQLQFACSPSDGYQARLQKRYFLPCPVNVANTAVSVLKTVAADFLLFFEHGFLVFYANFQLWRVLFVYRFGKLRRSPRKTE